MIGAGAWRAVRRLDAFGWGIVTGVMLLLLMGGLFELMVWDTRAPRFNVDVVSVGADVTRHGGVRVAVVNERGSVVQRCNGECDDLRLQESSADNSYSVRVIDRRGECVACTSGGYVTAGYGSSVNRFHVSGRDRLQVRESYLDANGSEIVFKPDARADAHD